MKRLLAVPALLLACSAPVPLTPRAEPDVAASLAVPQTLRGASDSSWGDGPRVASVTSGDPAKDRTGAPTPTGGIGTALVGGWISWAEPFHGGDYLATRFPRGTLVRICAVECLLRRTTDFGPHAGIRPNRIADLAVLDWEQICRLPRDRGLCPGTVEAIPEIVLPATDSTEGSTP